jgi:uncharacterized membrane protein
MGVYPGPERRRRARKRDLVTTRIIPLISGGLLLGLLWFGYKVLRSIYLR